MRFAWLLVALALIGGCEDKKWTSARELHPTLEEGKPIEPRIPVEELNIAIYPGAKAPKGLGPMVRSPIARGGFDSFIDCYLESPDAASKIVAFYRKELKKPTVSKSKDGGAQIVTLEGLNKKGESARVRVQTTPGEKMTMLSIRIKKPTKI